MNIWMFLEALMDNKTNDDGQMLFSDWEVTNGSVGNGSIDVNCMSYMGNKIMNWQQVFTGFEHLKIITYSYSLDFISELMENFGFKDCEIIIGHRNLVNLDTAELLLAEQIKIYNDVVNHMGRDRTLKEMIKGGSLKIHIVKHDFVVHSKTYMLKSDSGLTRVLNGSANATWRAWKSEDQLESYNLCDDSAFYTKESDNFDILCDNECDPIDTIEAKKITQAGGNLEDLPSFKDVMKTRGALIIDHKPEANVEYTFTPDAMKKVLRDSNVKPDKNGKVVISPEKVKKITVVAKEKTAEEAPIEQKLPDLKLDWFDETVSMNGESVNLSPDSDAIRSDISCWLEYMKGFDSFTGDTANLKNSAWRIMNHMFVSPFFAMLRYQDRQAVEISSGRHFPMYMLIMGPRDNGKSTLVTFIQKMMLGYVPETLHNDSFSAKIIQGLSQNVKGCPILFDDVNPKRWGLNCKEMVKEDSFLSKSDKFTNHPTFIMTSNGVQVPAEVVKRTVVIRLDNQLTTDAAADNERPMAMLQKRIGNSFYCEYLRRMFPKASEIRHRLREVDTEESALDIYKESSEIVLAILNEFGFDVPDGMRSFSWADYMGENTISANAIEEVGRLYKAEPERFTVIRSQNILRIDFADHSDRDKMILRLNEGLPATAERHLDGNTMSMRLDVMEERCGLSFRTGGGFFRRLRG